MECAEKRDVWGQMPVADTEEKLDDLEPIEINHSTSSVTWWQVHTREHRCVHHMLMWEAGDWTTVSCGNKNQ